MHLKKAPQWSSRDSQPPNAGIRLLWTSSFVDLFNFRQSHRRIRRVAAGLSSMSHNPSDFRNRNRRKRSPRQRSEPIHDGTRNISRVEGLSGWKHRYGGGSRCFWTTKRARASMDEREEKKREEEREEKER